MSLVSVFALAQTPADYYEVRRGNREFNKGRYSQAEIQYRKALIKDSTSVAARFDLARTLYEQGDLEGASKLFDSLEGEQLSSLSDLYFYQGNVALKQQNYNSAVEAYKQCLLRDPANVEAKESYLYAKAKLQEQQNQDQNQDPNQDQNQNQNQNQDKNQDQNQQDQQNPNRDQNQNQQNNPDQNKNDQQDNNDDGNAPQISPQAAQQMLQAIQAKEDQTQEKVKAEKALMNGRRQKDKNW